MHRFLCRKLKYTKGPFHSLNSECWRTIYMQIKYMWYQGGYGAWLLASSLDHETWCFLGEGGGCVLTWHCWRNSMTPSVEVLQHCQTEMLSPQESYSSLLHEEPLVGAGLYLCSQGPVFPGPWPPDPLNLTLQLGNIGPWEHRISL